MLCGPAYLSPPGHVVCPMWTPVYGCYSSMFSHLLFYTLSTRRAVLLQPWKQGPLREPAVDASWKLKVAPFQEACLSSKSRERAIICIY